MKENNIKLKLMFMAMAAGLLAGCSNKANDAKTAALESRISMLESNLARLTTRSNNQKLYGDKLFSLETNDWAANEEIELLLQTHLRYQESRIWFLEAQMTNLLTGAKPRPTAGVQQASPDQAIMPERVAAHIRAVAAALWPNDFEMQAYEIKRQTDAWHALNP
jgi:outer membrane murein-binding lipoprotein Lpp